MVGVVSQLNERFDVSGSGREQRVLLNCDELNDLSLFPTDYAWRHAGYPTEVSGQVALVGESR
jgi:hypothetical protein